MPNLGPRAEAAGFCGFLEHGTAEAKTATPHLAPKPLLLAQAKNKKKKKKNQPAKQGCSLIAGILQALNHACSKLVGPVTTCVISRPHAREVLVKS